MPVTKEKSVKKLADLSNAAKNSRSGRNKKRSDKEDFHLSNRQIFDDLDKLLHQIDTLQAHADKLKISSNIRSHDIDSFTSLLSDTRSSLQPWLTRFQASNLRQDTMTDDQSVQPSVKNASYAKDVEASPLRSPDKGGLGPLVSPSPLVSWHAKCEHENGQQLFLLTPLPKRGVFKCEGLSAYALKHRRTVYSNDGLLERETGESQGEKVTCPVDLEKSSDFPVSAFPKKTSSQFRALSTSKLSTSQRCSGTSYLMTPYLKMSPPKTCLLLEHVSEPHTSDENRPSESTPLTVRVLRFDEPHISKANAKDVPKTLASKYLDIFRPTTSKRASMERELEASLEHLISPPKTCLLLAPAPSADKCAIDYGVDQHKVATNNLFHDINVAQCQSSVPDDVLECNSLTLGKAEGTDKAPGEQTLKRELWAKFEAVSLHGSRTKLNCSESNQTQFLYRLEEVSSEE